METQTLEMTTLDKILPTKEPIVKNQYGANIETNSNSVINKTDSKIEGKSRPVKRTETQTLEMIVGFERGRNRYQSRERNKGRPNWASIMGFEGRLKADREQNL